MQVSGSATNTLLQGCWGTELAQLRAATAQRLQQACTILSVPPNHLGQESWLLGQMAPAGSGEHGRASVLPALGEDILVCLGSLGEERSVSGTAAVLCDRTVTLRSRR